MDCILQANCLTDFKCWTTRLEATPRCRAELRTHLEAAVWWRAVSRYSGSAPPWHSEEGGRRERERDPLRWSLRINWKVKNHRKNDSLKDAESRSFKKQSKSVNWWQLASNDVKFINSHGETHCLIRCRWRKIPSFLKFSFGNLFCVSAYQLRISENRRENLLFGHLLHQTFNLLAV